MVDPAWTAVADALRETASLQTLECDGRGHHLEGFAACLHLRIPLRSPEREELLGKLAPLVRRERFVLASLQDRPDLYNLTYRPGPRGGDLSSAASALAALLRKPDAWSAEAPDRRGRS